MENYIFTGALVSIFWIVVAGIFQLRNQFNFYKLLSEHLKEADRFAKLILKHNSLVNKYNDLLDAYAYATGQKVSDVQQQPASPIDGAYKTLGLDSTASKQEIKNKYRLLAKKYHPDHNKSVDANNKFRLINEAYKLLMNDGL